ncbi:MAG TPA: rhodanese-like domain-containing protein [Chitinophagaceae bacterium]|nr:rhodanese-like domain-containing protein [Chitinophagaceae bacterium]HQV86544.1 rhodanese-like domain-containing protein [Chitinophagaceae bacterium]HQZ74879.1 rhodanese-like domain-containing protein [Chitinophagaceae bacterium]
MALLLPNIKKKSLLIIAGGLLLAGLCSTVCVQAQDNTAGKTVSQNKFQRLINKKNTILLDVRTEVEYKAGHIPGSLQIDFLKTEDFKKQVAVLDKSKPYLLYCRSGKRSKDAMTVMKEMGFTKLFDLQGGFNSWEGVKEQ